MISLIFASVANHLWQSTLFAGVAGLLAQVLRKNHARARYWLWLTASVKFLLPFSLLVGIGSRISPRVPVLAQTEFSVVQQIGQPFTTIGSAHAPASTTLFATVLHMFPTLLIFLWLAGVSSVLFFWGLRWRRLTASIRGGSSVQEGREFEMLRRLEPSQGISDPIEIIISQFSLEPGITGIFRPRLLLPEGISDRLTDEQLAAIFAHELCHVRRRDNLAAAVHMLVEAVFWFHPLVWWIGARLVDERERACDEEVLRQGSDPQVYAESILKVCEFYLESPLFCAAGVTGSNLKKRIEAIMVHRIARRLDWGKKLLLATLGALAIIGPVVIGFLNPARSHAQEMTVAGSVPAQRIAINGPAFALDLVSIKPSTATQPLFFVDTSQGIVNFTGFTLKDLIKYSYALHDSQIVGGPDWISSERFDIRAMGPRGNALNFIQVQMGVQKLLADHFTLVLHRDTRELPVYALVVGKDGPKLEEIHLDNAALRKSRMLAKPPGHLEAQQVGMNALADILSSSSSSLVIDKTGLKGIYNFTLEWPMPSSDVVAEISTALPEQLGLELSKQTAPVSVLIVDSAEEGANITIAK